MKTKIYLAFFVLGIFSITTIQAQDKKTTTTTTQEQQVTAKTMYSCPMHANVKSEKPGKCPECGMELKETKGNDNAMAASYMCPMKCEGDKTYDKPGKCPKCGMKLSKMDMKKNKDNHKDHKH